MDFTSSNTTNTLTKWLDLPPPDPEKPRFPGISNPFSIFEHFDNVQEGSNSGGRTYDHMTKKHTVFTTARATPNDSTSLSSHTVAVSTRASSINPTMGISEKMNSSTLTEVSSWKSLNEGDNKAATASTSVDEKEYVVATEGIIILATIILSVFIIVTVTLLVYWYNNVRQRHVRVGMRAETDEAPAAPETAGAGLARSRSSRILDLERNGEASHAVRHAWESDKTSNESHVT